MNMFRMFSLEYLTIVRLSLLFIHDLSVPVSSLMHFVSSVFLCPKWALVLFSAIYVFLMQYPSLLFLCIYYAVPAVPVLYDIPFIVLVPILHLHNFGPSIP